MGSGEWVWEGVKSSLACLTKKTPVLAGPRDELKLWRGKLEVRQRQERDVSRKSSGISGKESCWRRGE